MCAEQNLSNSSLLKLPDIVYLHAILMRLCCMAKFYKPINTTEWDITNHSNTVLRFHQPTKIKCCNINIKTLQIHAINLLNNKTYVKNLILYCSDAESKSVTNVQCLLDALGAAGLLSLGFLLVFSLLLGLSFLFSTAGCDFAFFKKASRSFRNDGSMAGSVNNPLFHEHKKKTINIC